MRKLYRGVSKSMDDINEGKLSPKGSESSVTIKVGYKDQKVDGTWVVGLSEENAVRAHQLESGRYNGCLVSTTRDLKIARDFATSGNIEEGYIYVICEDKLNEFGVISYENHYPENSHELEVSLRAADNGDLPLGIVTDKFPVEPK